MIAVAQPVFPPSFPPRPNTVSAAAAPPSTPASRPSALTPLAGATASHPTLEQIVRIAHDEGHSDIHLGVGEVPRYRARGEMQTTEWPVSDLPTFQSWLQEILSPQQIDAFFREKEFDGSHAFPFVRIRINLLDSLRGPAMVLRLIPQTILTMDQLNLPAVLTELRHVPRV